MDLSNSAGLTTPLLCSKGCGFYGSKENRNMCSKCYKDFLKSELINAESAKLPAPVVQKPPIPIAPNPSVLDESCPSPQSATSSSETNVTVNSCSGGSSGSGNPRVKSRCKNCNKKVGLTGFKCRCGHLFCWMHRYPKEHACTYDFKKLDREILVKNNPLIKSDKLADKI